MVCFHPLTGYRSHGGAVVFDPLKGFRDKPVDLACGQCRGCRLERSRSWALRCAHEAEMHERNCFITLTYRDEDLPKGRSLCLEDWQKFAKRLRKKLGPFRFFHCGEYGDENLRPHYHACLFGIDFVEDQVFFKREHGSALYVSESLGQTWGLGFSTVGTLTLASAAYVARYVIKKVTGDLAERHYGGRRPEYATMSRRPGLGSSWFDKFMSDVFPADEVVHEGRSFPVPKFYDSKLGAEELEVYKVSRRRAARKRIKDLSPERLVVREKCADARAALFGRSL